MRHRRIPEKPTKATPVHPPPAISTLNGPPIRPSQAPSASSSRQNFVVVRNKGLKSKIPVSAGFLAVQGRLLSGKFPRKRPEIRLFHRADASQGCALACIQRAGRTVTIVARTVGSKVASLGVDLPCRHAPRQLHLRPYNRESTASRPICEVKHVLVWIVVRSGRTREVQML